MTTTDTQLHDCLAKMRASGQDEQSLIAESIQGLLDAREDHHFLCAWLDEVIRSARRVKAVLQHREEPNPIYVVEREGGDGIEHDLFLDESLANEWAEYNGLKAYVEYPIDRKTLDLLEDCTEPVERDDDEDDDTGEDTNVELMDTDHDEGED